jgi:hypothetical protein
MQFREDRIGACVIWTIRYYSNGLFCIFIILFLFLAVIPFISPERTVKLNCDGQRTLFFSPRCSSERIHWGLYWIFRGVFIIFAGMNNEAAMGWAGPLAFMKLFGQFLGR